MLIPSHPCPVTTTHLKTRFTKFHLSFKWIMWLDKLIWCWFSGPINGQQGNISLYVSHCNSWTFLFAFFIAVLYNEIQFLTIWVAHYFMRCVCYFKWWFLINDRIFRIIDTKRILEGIYIVSSAPADDNQIFDQCVYWTGRHLQD